MRWSCEMVAKTVSGGIRLIGARRDAGPGDHRMLAENKGGILHEHGVGIVGAARAGG